MCLRYFRVVDKFVSGKLLLFGEYAILSGGNALSIPSPNYGGRLKLGAINTSQIESNRSLSQFQQFLINDFSYYLNLAALENDLAQGLYFDSNIPVGSGIGSSAAVAAAILHEYGMRIPSEFSEKLDLFQQIEGYFHGKSSGIDLLTSYENSALLISAGQVSRVDVDVAFYSQKFKLIQSSKKSNTAEKVAIFQAQNKKFKQEFQDNYIFQSNVAIQAFLDKNLDTLKKALVQLSEFNYTKMPWVVPADLQADWKKSLEHSVVIYKCCGSGGGGFCYQWFI